MLVNHSRQTEEGTWDVSLVLAGVLRVILGICVEV